MRLPPLPEGVVRGSAKKTKSGWSHSPDINPTSTQLVLDNKVFIPVALEASENYIGPI